MISVDDYFHILTISNELLTMSVNNYFHILTISNATNEDC